MCLKFPQSPYLAFKMPLKNITDGPLKGSDNSSSQITNPPPVNSINMVPVQQLLVPSADDQGSDNVTSSIGPVPATPSIISNRRVDPSTQQPNVVNSVSNIIASQPLPRRVASIRHDEETASSQPVGNARILSSPRRTRSDGLVNVYTMTYDRRGYERS